MDARETVIALTDFVNKIGHDNKEFVEHLMNEHRTLQQQVFELMIDCIEAWSQQERYDLRNEHTVNTSKVIIKAIEDCRHVPFI